jgi:hypothetical protein
MIVTVIFLVIVTVGFFLLNNYPTDFHNMYWDKNGKGVHLLSSRTYGNPDGDSYTKYYHHYFDLTTGKTNVCDTIEDKFEFDFTLNELKRKTKLDLEIDYATKTSKPLKNYLETKHSEFIVTVFQKSKRFGKSNLIICEKNNTQLWKSWV